MTATIYWTLVPHQAFYLAYLIVTHSQYLLSALLCRALCPGRGTHTLPALVELMVQWVGLPHAHAHPRASGARARAYTEASHRMSGHLEVINQANNCPYSDRYALIVTWKARF